MDRRGFLKMLGTIAVVPVVYHDTSESSSLVKMDSSTYYRDYSYPYPGELKEITYNHRTNDMEYWVDTRCEVWDRKKTVKW